MLGHRWVRSLDPNKCICIDCGEEREINMSKRKKQFKLQPTPFLKDEIIRIFDKPELSENDKIEILVTKK